MIIVDEELRRRAEQGKDIRVGLIGAGFMGRALANQIVNSVPGMRLAAISNRNVSRARHAFDYAGVPDARQVDTAGELDGAASVLSPVVTENPEALIQAESIDCIVDVTGAVEFGARITLAAIEAGMPLVSMNAELDGTVGPILAQRARRAEVVITAADGDQPGVQMNLIRFVKGIGCTPLVAGNIKGLQDPYRTPETQRAFAERWGQDPAMVTSFADGTKISFEQAIVANATGMTISRRGMNGWTHEGHVDDLTTRYDVDALIEVGGIVDYVVGSRPSPGVFVLATHPDPKQRHYLDLYKLGTGPLYAFYTPYHLCHFEVPNSIARAVLFGEHVLSPMAGPQVDVIATAKTDLNDGDVIDGLGGFHTYGQAETSPKTRAEGLLPMGIAVGCRVLRPVPKDEPLRYADVELPAGRLIDQLRSEQTALFGPAEGS